MKIAISSTGTDLSSQVDPRFGRAAYLVIVESDTLKMTVLDNKENANAFKGAGIQAAGMVSREGAEVLLTGYCGPNAFKTLKAAGVGVANDASGTIEQAVKDYMDGKYTLSDSANTEGHW